MATQVARRAQPRKRPATFGRSRCFGSTDSLFKETRVHRLLSTTGALLLAAGLGAAQTAPGSSTSSSSPPPSPPGTSMGAPPAPNAPNPSDKAAASGNDNQAVATTGANADQPAKGANSFTMREARGRLQKHGYSHVAGLKKDHDGVWRGTAQKDGQPVNVWLDYKGNVGQQS